MLLENNHCPKNESKEHYELKQIGKYFLRNKGYKIIGEEIELDYCTYLTQFSQFNKHAQHKSIIDVVGLQMKDYFGIRKEPTFKLMGIEAKVSLSDFKNGFNTNCEKTYIIAPVEVIPIELIPKNIGLIEVDLNTYKINKTSIRNGWKFESIFETIKPKINLDTSFKHREKPIQNKEYQAYCKNILKNIGQRYSNDTIYNKNEIYVKGL